MSDQQQHLSNLFKLANAVIDNLHVRRRLDFSLLDHWERKRAASRNPLVKAGRKFYSQTDEDGILIEMLRRMELQSGTFAELGVGNGMENNTLILLMMGFKGVWIGGQDLAIRIPGDCANLHFTKAWITRENVMQLLGDALGKLAIENPDVLSVDLDGNEFHLIEEFFANGLRPRILITEYNAKFPPPVDWVMAYDAKHNWDGTDYQGASLAAFNRLMAANGYQLVACNITGSNAFYVQRSEAGRFADVPQDAAELFEPADYNWFYQMGHKTSARTIESFLRAPSSKA